MAEIHMETENVREAARQIDLLAGELYYQPGKLNNLGNSLSGMWQGGKSGRFAARRFRWLSGRLRGHVIGSQFERPAFVVEGFEDGHEVVLFSCRAKSRRSGSRFLP